MPNATPRMTLTTQLVLQAFLHDPTRELFGAEISAGAGVATGTVHPILARLEGLGWVESRWEDVDPAVAGRPARRFYRLTADGAENATRELARVRRPGLHPPRFDPLPGQP